MTGAGPLQSSDIRASQHMQRAMHSSGQNKETMSDSLRLPTLGGA